MRIAAEFLTQCQWCGVLGMGAADFDNIFELFRLCRKRRVQFAQTRQQRVTRHHADGDMHGRWESIVGRLTHIAMIIRVHRCFGGHGAAQNLNRAVRDDLVRVHVGLSARPGLPNDQRKVIVKFAVDHLLGGLLDCGGQPCVKIAKSDVHFGAGHFDHTQRADDRDRLAFPPDGKVHDGALGLRAPILVCGDLKRAKAIGFGACIGHLAAPAVKRDLGRV